MKLSFSPLLGRSEHQPITVRSAEERDRQAITNLLHFENRTHRHLDWRRPLEWIGSSPFLVAEQAGEIISAFACPPDPPEIAWLRLFSVSTRCKAEDAWDLFWPAASEQFFELGSPAVAAIPTQPWLRKLLEKRRFHHVHDVVSLLWQSQPVEPPRPHPQLAIRLMSRDDLPAIAKLDAAAFGPLWHNSLEALEIAFWQSVVATAAEWDGQVVGYQISTATPMGGHLARLAVHPAVQGCGIGYSIVWDVLDQFRRKAAIRVSVNTQKDNLASLALYEKVGFQRTGEEFPVYQYTPN